MKTEKKCKLPHVWLYEKQDRDLIGWLEELSSQPYGTKGQIIKQTLRRGLAISPSTKGSHTQRGSCASFDSQELLCDIRRVVEATLESAISRLSISPLSALPINPVPDGIDEINTMLDDFGASLMMLDEEEDDV